MTKKDQTRFSKPIQHRLEAKGHSNPEAGATDVLLDLFKTPDFSSDPVVIQRMKSITRRFKE